MNVIWDSFAAFPLSTFLSQLKTCIISPSKSRVEDDSESFLILIILMNLFHLYCTLLW